MKMKTDYNILTFKTINDFVNELTKLFGSSNHSLKLYQRLLDKTTINHEKSIEKHISIFKSFCTQNRDMILNKDVTKLSSTHYKVEFSDKVYVNFNDIFKVADKDTKSVIFDYLLTISALVDPAAKAKDILKKDEKSKEADFLSSMIEKVEENVNIDSSNPLDAVSSIMNSGIFTELLSNMNNGLQDGSLDLGKLVGTVEKLCSSMAPKDGSGGANGAPNLNLAGLLQSLNLGGMGGLGGGGDVIDPSNIINALSSPTFNPDIGK